MLNAELENLISGLLSIFQTFIFLLLLSFGVVFGLRYYDRYTTKVNVENFMIDMLEYASKHDGFNDPSENSELSFEDVKNDYIKRYKLEGKIEGNTISFSPAPNTEVWKGRSSDLKIELTPLYASLNPLDKTRVRGKRLRSATSITHGYVKNSDDKTYDYEMPAVNVTGS